MVIFLRSPRSVYLHKTTVVYKQKTVVRCPDFCRPDFSALAKSDKSKPKWYAVLAFSMVSSNQFSEKGSVNSGDRVRQATSYTGAPFYATPSTEGIHSQAGGRRLESRGAKTIRSSGVALCTPPCLDMVHRSKDHAL